MAMCVRGWVGALVSELVSGQFSDQKSSDVARRRQTLYDVARLLLMVPIELWRNFTPDFGAAAFCTTKIDDFRASLTSPLRSSRWPRSKVSDVTQLDH